MQRVRCALRGHADGAPFRIGNVWHVRCAECGRFSDGMPLSEPRYRLTQTGKPRRHRLHRPPRLVVRRHA
jgi:hypothetical protein